MRRVLKTCVLAVMFGGVLPAGVTARLLHRLTGSAMLFNLFAQWFAVVPGIFGVYARICYYKQTLARAEFDGEFAFGSMVTKISAEIGHRVYVGLYSTVGYAEIGDDCVLANFVSILSGRRQHNFADPDRPIFSNEDTFAKVTIGENCFFGDKSTVMANVGRRTIVGAGSVVVDDIPEYVIAAGSPAKPVRDRRPGSPAGASPAAGGEINRP